MTSSAGFAWTRIHDFLIDIGSATAEDELVRRIIEQVGTLVPHDVCSVFGVFDPRGTLCVPRTMIGDARWARAFAEHYWSLMPDVSHEKGNATKSVDWRRYRRTEYVADFLTPQRIRYSIGVSSLGSRPGHVGTLALNRSGRSRPFDDREQAILEILQPHLSNLYRLVSRSAEAGQRVPDAFELAELYPRLTRRESEVAALICRGYSTAMIESKMLVSRLTVYKHLEHVFEKLRVSSRDELRAKVSSTTLAR